MWVSEFMHQFHYLAIIWPTKEHWSIGLTLRCPQAGDVENAKHCLGRAVTVQPDEGYRKFLSLAQLFDGQQSLQLYRQGIDIISKQQQASEGSDLSRDLSSTFCAIADLFMTDLCDEGDAESECTKAIESAVKADEKNPEAWQTKARLELIKNQFEVIFAAIDAFDAFLSYEFFGGRSDQLATVTAGLDKK